MAIDFSFPEELTFIVSKVRDFCEQVVAPSTKEIEPTVAVDITNNNYAFDVTQVIRSNAEPGEVAREAAEAIKKEFDLRLSVAGQQLQPNLVR